MSVVKPYKVIEGSHQALAAFESAVAAALEEGYSLAGDLVIKTSGTELKFFQPVMTFLEDEDEDEDDEEEDDED